MAGTGGGDWAAQTADTVERVVGTVGSKVESIERVGRFLVYGLVAAFLGLMALVLLAIALVRFADYWIPGEVWSAHAAVGGIFTVVGLLLWRKRTIKTVKV